MAVLLLCAGMQLVAQQTDAELDGRWDGVSSATGGKTREFKAGEVYMLFAGTRLVGKGIVAVGEKHISFTVDPTKRPKQLTYWAPAEPDSKHDCIYEIKDDTLTIAVPVVGGRPTSFVEEGHTKVLLVLKRRKSS
jgi:uncharacterized protein (TIGR03067 family)